MKNFDARLLFDCCNTSDIVMHDHINMYHYCVNTFDKRNRPVQLSGYVYGESEENAIQELIRVGVVNSRGYEFLELQIVWRYTNERNSSKSI